MSLIDEFMTPCKIMDKQSVSDGEGGFTSTWVESALIDVAITLDTSIASRVAQREGTADVYTLTTKKDVVLEFHDVIKRVSDGTYFRVTSNGHDKTTPISSSLSMRVVTAERWVLTT